MSIYNQQEFDIRFEWGLRGVEELAPVSEVIIVVDVLSFSTCVDVAVARGALVYPYRFKDDGAIAYAAQIGAVCAGKRSHDVNGYSLSPASLINIEPLTRLVLPSPNGSTLSLATGQAITVCGCLRNARAVAEYAMKKGNKIAVIAAGEQWHNDSLRPAWEDMTGAGAIISFLTGSLSPESRAAVSVFKDCAALPKLMDNCVSGKELIDKGFSDDVKLASAFNVSNTVPVLINGAYSNGK